MKSYSCKPCDYFTFNKNDFEKHSQTKKHLTNCPEQVIPSKSRKLFECINCHASFESEDLLTKHGENCLITLRIKIMMLEKDKEKSDLQKEKLELKLESALKELDLRSKFHEDIDRQKERTIDFIEGENKYHKDSLDKQSNAVNKITSSAIKFLQQHCPNAPRLEAPENYDSLWEDLVKKNKFLKEVSAWNANNHLDERLSERLLKIYKKEDAKDQSLWGLDTSRSNYAEKEDDWTIDKKGVNLKEKIIKPFVDDLYQRVRDEYEAGIEDSFLEGLCGSLITTLVGDNEWLIQSILKKMCASLYLDKEGKMKNGKYLTYVEPKDKEKKEDDKKTDKKHNKKHNKKSNKKSKKSDETLDENPEEPNPHLTDSSDHPSDSDQCDRKYDEICKRYEKEKAQKEQKEIVIIDTKKKGKRV